MTASSGSRMPLRSKSQPEREESAGAPARPRFGLGRVLLFLSLISIRSVFRPFTASGRSESLPRVAKQLYFIHKEYYNNFSIFL